MNRYVVLAAVLLITACAKPAAPGIEVRTLEVPVEVQAPCPGIAPVAPGPLDRPLPDDAVALAAVLAAKLVEYVGPGKYVDRVEAYVAACPPAERTPVR